MPQANAEMNSAVDSSNEGAVDVVRARGLSTDLVQHMVPFYARCLIEVRFLRFMCSHRECCRVILIPRESFRDGVLLILVLTSFPFGHILLIPLMTLLKSIHSRTRLRVG